MLGFRNAEMKQLILRLGALFVAWYFSMIILLYCHESVHVAIYKAYDCYASFSLDPISLSGTTYAINNCNLPKEGYFLHALNELVGYNLVAVISIVFLNAAITEVVERLFSR